MTTTKDKGKFFAQYLGQDYNGILLLKPLSKINDEDSKKLLKNF